MNYLITIIDLKTFSKSYLERDDETLDSAIKVHLGGWENLSSAGTSNRNIDEHNHQSCGTTKDGRKMFSILAYKS